VDKFGKAFNSDGVAVGNRKLEAALQGWNRLIFLVDLEIVVCDIGIEVDCAWVKFLFVHAYFLILCSIIIWID
jgi:hypothetical protein